MTALQGARKRRGLGGLARGRRPAEAEDEVARLAVEQRLLAGVADRGRAGGLLRPDLQRDALAALPLLRRPHALHARGLGRLRRRQPALRRGDRRASARRGPGSGFTTSTSRSFRVSCGALRPDLAIGFFLHIPFPSSEIYRLLPTRTELLRGMLGADYIGFHTGDYARHFRSSCLRVLGIETGPDTIDYDDRTIGIGVAPDRDRRRELPREPARPGDGAGRGRARRALRRPAARARRRAARLHEGHPAEARCVRADARAGSGPRRPRDDAPGARALAARERGVPGDARRDRDADRPHQRALRAARALARRLRASLGLAVRAGRALPSGRRDDGDAAPRRHEPRRAGVRPVPDRRSRRRREPERRAAPERVRGRGARPARRGARQPLGCRRARREARRGARARRSGAPPAPRADGEPRRAARQRELGAVVPRTARAVRASGGSCWLGRSTARRGRGSAGCSRRRRSARSCSTTTARSASSSAIRISPSPTTEIRDLLGDLAALPSTSVHVVSGRTRESLDAWLGDLPISLCAEHGYLVRPAGGEWTAPLDVDLHWLPRVERLFRRVAADVPGTMVERKTASVAWHYRQAEPEYGIWRARELLVALENVLAGIPAEVLPGRRVIEVRARGVNKGVYLESVLAAGAADPGDRPRGGRRRRPTTTSSGCFRTAPSPSTSAGSVRERDGPRSSTSTSSRTPPR